MTSDLAKTPLHQWHVAHGARMVDFAGWSMPVQYSSIVAEHQATRSACGVFDVSHMGRFRFEGPGAAPLLDRLLTRRVAGMQPGKIRYSLMTNEQGGILDDVLVYRLDDPGGDEYYQLVVNAGNRTKIAGWIESYLSAGDVSFIDATADTAMIAVQGPRALSIVAPLLDMRPADLGYYTGAVGRIANARGIVSRTGYTGEDGCELIVPAEHAADVWQQVFDAGAAQGIAAAGLGARDTLRLEAAMPLYGHELDEQINPYQAGLGFAVNLKDREFVGRDALVNLKNDPEMPQRIGLQLGGRRVPREDYAVLAGGEKVGHITSGTFSPTLERPIAMAYVHRSAAAVGNELAVDIRGRREPARVVELPFYSRPS